MKADIQMNKQLILECAESWEERLRSSHERIIRRKNIVDDGFFSHMAKNAELDGIFGIPVINGFNGADLPEAMIPFSKLGRSTAKDECVCFFEKDPMFADVLVASDEFIDDLRDFPLVLSPDCSLYRDMPLAAQIANTYLSRLVGHYFEECGLNVVPTIRWSDERSYATCLFNKPFAFEGAPHNSTLAVGTYGCIRGAENKKFFREGLEAMLRFLTPKRVLVYGSMPDDVFGEYVGQATFVQYEDWITRCHGRAQARKA